MDLLFTLGEGFAEYACGLQVRDEAVAEVLGVERTDVIAVDRLCLLHVEACGVGNNVVHVEVLDEPSKLKTSWSAERDQPQGQVVQQAFLDEAGVAQQEEVSTRGHAESFFCPGP